MASKKPTLIEELKTFSLLFCDTQMFLSQRNKPLKIKAVNHSAAMDVFLDDFQSEMLNQTVMTFCYEEMASQFGYLYSVTSEK
ncbi:hypothetical protein Q4503_16600 [Colwellia sp. 6_MG-2023]|jgi:hypothetical protein|uniref:hypothetical protein n=1 Tax=Colwellia sp. 6_MG-2023 TaxID=3062676 RepID=UPI0026E2C4BE|nr:hypothetical protein [Colwellia sp. 6_MG-2023]MDO6489317.1 hypothetical protein [Colwellia sp. 6_MG-2023]